MSVGSDRRADALAQACARAMWARDRASQGLGIELEQVRAGYARATMRVTDEMLNGHDVCHGGFVFLLADTAFAFACNTGDAVTLAAGCDIVFVASAHAGDELVAEARERVRFGRSGVYDVTVGRRGDDAIVAEFRGRSRTTDRRILPGRA
ncbi:MAG TPA: hydroxyphenylacetyl-CoA thioesterase PaaI [Gaiellales bacterium]|nr:hydroxyphenylacetyl-CoA thioesterase PaaI [Gaiellales bacterium]